MRGQCEVDGKLISRMFSFSIKEKRVRKFDYDKPTHFFCKRDFLITSRRTLVTLDIPNMINKLRDDVNYPSFHYTWKTDSYL